MDKQTNQPNQSHRPQQSRPANRPVDRDHVRVIPLGGQDFGGAKNMIIIEYGNDAIVTDAGHWLGVDLPGVNYSIPNIEYLEKIKNKIRGYVMTHGHLDHIGAITHILPKVPAPVYGSRFTLGMVQKEFDDESGIKFRPQLIPMNEDNHDRVKIGPFTVELIRVTHSIPGSTAIVIDTPVGRIINTGDFRLDPEPLDQKPTDIERFKQLGREGVLLLLSESTTTERMGRTPTEFSLVQSFHNILGQAKGRVIVASFASNVNRVQMIIDASVKSGRKVAIVGRSMLAHVELAVKLGILKVPMGTIVRTSDMARVPDRQVTIICTGGQGEEFAALSRMAAGDHKYIKIKSTDTVVFSSTPIPYTGNDASIRSVIDGLYRLGATVFRHETYELDGCGPLHVSGHASIDEYADMITMLRPKYFMPIYGDFTSQKRHLDIAHQAGMRPEQCLLADNGEVLEVRPNNVRKHGRVPAGGVLVDNTGSEISGVVVNDRVLMMKNGILITVITLRADTKEMLTSPDIITRGFIHISESQELMRELRDQVRKITAKHIKRQSLDNFKLKLRDELSDFIYKKMQQNPIILPVVNLIDSQGRSNVKPKPKPDCA